MIETEILKVNLKHCGLCHFLITAVTKLINLDASSKPHFMIRPKKERRKTQALIKTAIEESELKEN